MTSERNSPFGAESRVTVADIENGILMGRKLRAKAMREAAGRVRNYFSPTRG